MVGPPPPGAERPAASTRARPQDPLPIWVGVGGTPESFVRAGLLGLPLMVAIIGGEPRQFAPLDRPLPPRRRAGRAPSRAAEGRAARASASSATTSRRRPNTFYPGWEADVHDGLPRARLRCRRPGAQFDATRGPDGAFFVGDPDQVAAKLRARLRAARRGRPGQPADDEPAPAPTRTCCTRSSCWARSRPRSPTSEVDPFRASEASEATGNVVVTALDEQPGDTGPLAGWRVGVKDNIGVAGVRSTCGSAFFADHVAPADAEVVTRLRAAGAGITADSRGARRRRGVRGGRVVPAADPLARAAPTVTSVTPRRSCRSWGDVIRWGHGHGPDRPAAGLRRPARGVLRPGRRAGRAEGRGVDDPAPRRRGRGPGVPAAPAEPDGVRGRHGRVPGRRGRSARRGGRRRVGRAAALDVGAAPGPRGVGRARGGVRGDPGDVRGVRRAARRPGRRLRRRRHRRAGVGRRAARPRGPGDRVHRRAA